MSVFGNITVFPFVVPPVSRPSQYKNEYWYLASDWMRCHMEYPIFLSILYVTMVFGIQSYMKPHKAYSLNTPLIFWNVFLAVFSMIGTVFTIPPIIMVMMEKGFTYEMCTIDAEYQNPWVFFFCLSKIPEFIDTLFLVLKKREVIFLHWYHHIATMWFCWIAWAVGLENGGAFTIMNLIVHSIMYSYYAGTAAKMSWTKYIRQYITTIQILQMVLGALIVIHNIVACNTHPVEHYFGLVMYISYALLFVDLYYKNYISKGKSKSE